MEWQPIETAPRDGTHILITDGLHFAAGYLAHRIEDDWKFLGYDEGVRYPDGGLKIGERFTERVANPNAGKRHEWWHPIGCSAFSDEIGTSDYDGPVFFEPTHWMPLPKPPVNVSEPET